MQYIELVVFSAAIRKCLNVLYICTALNTNHTSDKHSREPITWLRHVPYIIKFCDNFDTGTVPYYTVT